MDAEQRLREIAEYITPPYSQNVTLAVEDGPALVGGADALALLRVIRDEQAESLHQAYVDQITALLTRAGRA